MNLELQDHTTVLWVESFGLVSKIPLVIKNQFWKQFIEAIEEELAQITSQLEQKKTLFDLWGMSEARILELLDEFQIAYEGAVSEDIPEFLRRYLASLAFLIYWKTTPKAYRTVFSEVKRRGEVYITYRTDRELLPSVKPLLKNLAGDTPLFLEANTNYIDQINRSIYLDTGLGLDGGEGLTSAWQLDNAAARENANSLFLEFFLDRCMETEDRKTYLLPERYFHYLRNTSKFIRSVSDVILYGAQLTAMLKLAHDIFDTRTKLSGHVTPYFMQREQDVSLVVGSGVHESFIGITGLKEAKAKRTVHLDSLELGDTHNAYSAWFPGKLNNLEVLGYGTGATVFEQTLRGSPIEKNSIRIRYKHNNIVRNVFDNGVGQLLGEGQGELDYTSGSITLRTVLRTKRQLSLFPANDLPLNMKFFEGTLESRVLPGTLQLFSGEAFLAVDDGKGGIFRGSERVGKIDYQTGEYFFNLGILWDVTVTWGTERLERFQHTTTAFSGTLEAPVKPGTLLLHHTLSQVLRHAKDDGKGGIKGANIRSGTIVYATGAYSIEFWKAPDAGVTFIWEHLRERQESRVVEVIDGFPRELIGKVFWGTLGTEVTPSTFLARYTLGGITHTVQDNGEGALLGVGVQAGSVSYSTGEFFIELREVPEKEVSLTWEYPEELPPDIGSPIEVVYYSRDYYSVREAGILDNRTNRLMAYATFPAIEVPSKEFHLTVNFVVDLAHRQIAR